MMDIKEHQQVLFINFLTKKLDQSVNEELAEKLHKLVIKKFKRRRVYARFKDNIQAADLTEMGSLFSKNNKVRYLLCVIDIFTKYAWVKPLKDKKGQTVLNASIKIVNEFNCKPNKLENFYEKELLLSRCKKDQEGFTEKNCC